MEEFLKSHFVQYKQLIFEELGILTLNIIPAYFDVQHQQLFPSYFNYAFSPNKSLKNEAIFFHNISQYLNISNQEAQQLYKEFTADLISEFTKNESFKIPHLAIVRHVNNAYLVEIDSNLQMVFNPIGINQKKINHKPFTTAIPIYVPPLKSAPTMPSPIALNNIVAVEKKHLPPLPVQKETPKKQAEKKIIHKTSSTLKREQPIVTEISNQTINKIIIYCLIAIILLVLLLIGIKFWIFNDTNFLSSLWK